MVKNKALITGILGQDGSLLGELLSKDYEVYGLVKNGTSSHRMDWIRSLIPSVKLVQTNMLDKTNLYQIIKHVRPQEIYNMAGVSNVFDAWENIDEILSVNAGIPQTILESILKIDRSIKFFQASSCLIFGRDTSKRQNENTPSNPLHPYGAAKLFADNIVKEFRNQFGLYCCSGIFFSHESPRRPDDFFSKKVTLAAARIKQGKQMKLILGDLSSFKDYGYAPDFMEAVHLMMTNSKPTDYVIGTGVLISLEEFVEKSFQKVGLDYRDYVSVDVSIRRNDTNVLRADISKITKELGWYPKHSVDDIISIMVQSSLEN